MRTVITMNYESLDKIESKKEIEELNSIKYKGLNHPLCLTRLHGITHALVYGSQRMEDYTKQHKCMFDKYISQNIKLYHDKTYQYHIKRSKYVMKFSREFVRKSDDYNSRKNKMSKYLFKVRLYTKLIEIVQQHCLDEIMITKHALLLKIDTYYNAGNLFLDKDITYDPNMFDESIERFKHLMMSDEESINNKLMKVYEGVDEENLN